MVELKKKNVGSQETPGVTGKFGLGVWNEAGQRLIAFYQENTLVIANTLFQQHKRRLYTWTSPDGQHRNQTDYILYSQRWRSSIQAKWLSEEPLQITVKIRELKNKGVKERYSHLNAEFQRIARRGKKAFLSDQCKEIEENNRMGKTRDLFKKIRDIKGTLQAKMGSIKDRNGMDLTEAEDIKKR